MPDKTIKVIVDVVASPSNKAAVKQMAAEMEREFTNANRRIIEANLSSKKLPGTGGKSMTAVGSNLVDGLAMGIKNSASKVGSTMTSLVNQLISKTKSLLGIRSPSTVFHAIGQNIMSGLQSGLSSAASGITSFFGNFFGNLASSIVSGLASMLSAAAKEIFNFSARMEQTQIGFETLMGGTQQATAHLKELQKFAIETPFEFEGLAKLSRRLQGAGVEAKKIVPLLKDIGNAASAAGASGEDLDGIVLAFSQIIAKGRVSAEEVNQLAERGIPVWKILSEQFGKSKREIMKFAEAGVITSDMFVDAFQKFSQNNFGDSMQKQSKTFLGAWSSIKDMTMQLGTELFKPVYDETAKFAVKFSESLQSQMPAAKAASEKFGFALGESIGDGIRRANWGEVAMKAGNFIIAGALTGYADQLGKLVTEGVGKGFGEGLVKGLKTANLSIADLRKLDDTTGKISDDVWKMKNATDSMNPLDKALAAAKAQKETEKLVDIIKNVNSEIKFFGQNTEVSKVKQQLWNAEITNFDSALAKSAISLAKQLDGLKAAEKAQEEYNQKVKNFSEELKNVQEKANFDLRYPNATELDQFNEKVKKSGLEFGSLRKEIDLTRQSLRNLAIARSSATRGDAVDSFRRQIDELQNELKGVSRIDSEFDKGIETFLSPFGLSKAQEDEINAGIRDRLRQHYSNLAKTRNEEEAKFQDGLSTTAFDNWAKKFKTKEGVQIFADEAGMFEAFERFWNTLAKKDAAENLKLFNDVVGDLDSEIHELNVELGLSAELTRADAAAKQLLTNTYKDLSAEQKQAIIDKAKEVDSLEAAVKAQDEYKRAFEQTADVFEDAIDKLSQGNWKGFFQSLLDEMRRFLVRAAAEWLTSKFFKLASGQGTGTSSGGFSLGNLMKILSGGGLSNGNRTPSFNPDPFANMLTTLPDGTLATQVNGGGSMWPGWGQIAQDKNKLQQIFGGGSGSSIFGKGGMFGAKGFGMNAGTAGGIGAIGAMAGSMIPGKWGNLLSMAGTGASIGSSFGPWGAAIGAGVGAIAGLFSGGFFGGGIDKKLKQAVKNAYGMETPPEALKQLKILAKSMPGASADEVVRTDIARDILLTYAEGTNQSAVDRLDPNRAYDASHSSNIYNSLSQSTRGLSTASGAANSFSSGSGKMNVFMLAQLTDAIQTFNEKFSTASPQSVIMAGAEGASGAIAAANQKEMGNNPQLVNTQQINMGFAT